MSYVIFLPCRSGSKRVKNKSTKKFLKFKLGLFEIKINQLIKLNVDKIIVSTNIKDIFKYLKKLNSKKIILDKRPNNLCKSSTTTDDLIKYVPRIVKNGHVIWTHVTSPLFDANDYRKAINIYKKKIKLGSHDSLMSVNDIKKFIWFDNKPLNYATKKTKWPFTQEVKPIKEIDSAIFINSIENYKKYNDRIGKKPFLFENYDFANIDIDDEKDFRIAELIYKKFKG